MKMVEEFKKKKFKFYFFNLDFSITIQNSETKLKEYHHNILTEGTMSQFFLFRARLYLHDIKRKNSPKFLHNINN